MIKKEFMAEILNENAIYSPCTVLSIGDKTVTIEYCAGLKTLKGGLTKKDIKRETLRKENIKRIVELL